jgi:HopA1 effector protein family
MNGELEQDLRPIIDALIFHSAEAFTFAGRPSAAWMAPAPPPAAGPAAPAVQTLQSVLYAFCYMKRFAGAIEDSSAGAMGDEPAWVEGLSAANASRDRWEEGWQVQQFLPTGQVQAYKAGATRAFWPGEFVTRGAQGMAPQPGTPMAAFFPRESRNMQPGFYFIFGETAGDQQDEYSTVRYYWNIRREGAVPLVQSLTGALNRYQVPFRFKIVNHPALLGRSDAAILYVSRRFYRIAAELALDTHGAVAASLDAPVPLFTRRLEKGLAFAEDPGTQESFGMSRCRLLAEGLWQAFQEGLTRTADRLDRVARHFASAGTSLERSHLNLAAVDPYEFPQ